jgi:hypothetical protein
MPAEALVCPKCRERMEEGFMADVSHGFTLIARWVPGKPKAGMVSEGTNAIRKKTKTYRCCKCGYLESYAP